MTLPSAMCWSDAPKLFPHLQGYCQNFRSRNENVAKFGPTFSALEAEKNPRQSLFGVFFKIQLTLGCAQPIAPVCQTVSGLGGVQESIRFTHCKLDYNMGWLVQAEAHPGALFRAFRKVILDRPQAPQLQGAVFHGVGQASLAANLWLENVKQHGDSTIHELFLRNTSLIVEKTYV